MRTTIILFLITTHLSSDAVAQSWKQTLNGRSVWSLAYDGFGTIYAGGLTSSNSRIWKTTDAGDTWDTIYFGAGQTMWDFGFDQQGTIFVANFSNGLLKSSNNGVNFTVIPISSFNNKNLQGVECGAPGYVFVTTSSGFFRSSDSGNTFTETALTGLNCLPVSVDNDSSNIVYVGVTSAGGTGVGFYRSTDNGLTFSENLNPGKNGYNIAQDLYGNVFMISTTAPYSLDKSTDNGLTWATINNFGIAQRGLAVGYANDMYTAGNGGVFKSVNGGSVFLNYGFTQTSTPVLYVEFNATAVLCTGVSGTTAGGVWITAKVLSGIESSAGIHEASMKLFPNFPNPFNPKTIITFDVTKRSRYRLAVFDNSGKEIRVLSDNMKAKGRYKEEFSAAGLSSGLYYAVLSGNGEVQIQKMVLLK